MNAVERIEAVLRILGVEVTERTPRRIWARCPSGNHEDARPSWSIMVEGENTGQHYCQSCKWGDSLVGLVMKVRGVGFYAAKEWLSGVGAGEAEREVVTGLRVEIRPIRPSLFQIPPGVEFRPFERWPDSIRRYALSRGITAEQVDRWGIGYAIDGRLAGRIVIVTRDGYGRPANYTGRTIGRDPRRYFNATNAEGPDLKVLFGEEHWSGKFGDVFVTEGALNALALERVLPPFPDLAALSGSRIHGAVIAKLSRFRRVVDLTDPDRAGDEASLLLFSGLVAAGTEHVRVRLPEKTDAADLSPDALHAVISAMVPGALSAPPKIAAS